MRHTGVFVRGFITDLGHYLGILNFNIEDKYAIRPVWSNQSLMVEFYQDYMSRVFNVCYGIAVCHDLAVVKYKPCNLIGT